MRCRWRRSDQRCEKNCCEEKPPHTPTSIVRRGGLAVLELTRHLCCGAGWCRAGRQTTEAGKQWFPPIRQAGGATPRRVQAVVFSGQPGIGLPASGLAMRSDCAVARMVSIGYSLTSDSFADSNESKLGDAGRNRTGKRGVANQRRAPARFPRHQAGPPSLVGGGPFSYWCWCLLSRSSAVRRTIGRYRQ